MHEHDLLLAGIAFGAEVLGTLSGFGSSTFFVPAAVLFEDGRFVLALTGILHCFSNVWKLILFRRHFAWKEFWLLSIPFVLCTGTGAVLTRFYSPELMHRTLGGFLVLVGVASFFSSRHASHPHRALAIGIGCLSGLATGFVGTGGAIRGLALIALRLPKESFVAVSAGIDMGGDVLRTGIYVGNGFMNWEQWFYIPALGIAAYLGARVGQVWLGYINQAQFEKIVAVFVALSGLVMAFRNEP